MRAPWSGDDRGTIAMYTVLFTPVVFLLAGLLVDGGLAIHARQRAADMAEQAARAGADNIDEDALRRTGRARVIADGPNGTTCTRAYRLLREYDENVTDRDCLAAADRVEVTVQITVPLQLLAIVPGFSEFTMRSTAAAEPQTGAP